MDEYNVILSSCARSDFHDVIDHMNILPPEAATRSFDFFMEKMAFLEASPNSSPLARDAQLRLRGYRLFPVDNYIVFYVIRGNVVEIRRILYARRQYERLF